MSGFANILKHSLIAPKSCTSGTPTYNFTINLDTLKSKARKTFQTGDSIIFQVINSTSNTPLALDRPSSSDCEQLNAVELKCNLKSGQTSFSGLVSVKGVACSKSTTVSQLKSLGLSLQNYFNTAPAKFRP
jgi:hypothetical protein